MSSWRSKWVARARIILNVVGAGAVAAGLVAVSPGAASANAKYAAIVVDTATGKVLYDSNADARRYPASLTKMMTLYVLFEDLERGKFRLDSKLKVSANAAAQPPSKLGLKAGSTISVEDAIKALVTKSANDVATTVGENVGGSIPAFADRMTRTARALGMKGTVFKNPHGLPNGGQYTTARDMMKLGVALQVRFPNYYTYFQTRSFTYKGRKMGNHNRLLGRVDGVDGIKTGFINASGFNLVSSVKRDGRKVVAVVMGGKTARSRDAHMEQLIAAYLPKASRGKGYDPDLVAAVKNAPSVVAAAAVAPPTVQPRPRPQIAIAVAAAVPAPVEVASLAVAPQGSGPLPQAAPDGARIVRTVALELPPAETAEVVPAVAKVLPSSAAEAFADIGPAPSSAEADALAAMIDARISAVAYDAGDQVETGSTKMAAVAPPPRKSEVPRAAITGWLIQIGAVDTEASANALLEKARAKAAKALSGASPMTETFSKGSQTFVRARFAGFDSEKAAQKACATLKKNEFACFTLRL